MKKEIELFYDVLCEVLVSLEGKKKLVPTLLIMANIRYHENNKIIRQEFLEYLEGEYSEYPKELLAPYEEENEKLEFIIQELHKQF